jgi:tRNA(Ile)-lysidine synthase
VVADGGHEPSTPDKPLLQIERLPLKLPGRTDLPGTKWRAETDIIAPDELPTSWERNPDRWQVFLDSDAVGSSLLLRTRSPGDRFQPLGMDGRTATVSDFMINLKLDRHLRDRWPLLAGTKGIAWVVGFRQDQRTRVTASSRKVVRVRLHRIAGGD